MLHQQALCPLNQLALGQRDAKLRKFGIERLQLAGLLFNKLKNRTTKLRRE